MSQKFGLTQNKGENEKMKKKKTKKSRFFPTFFLFCRAKIEKTNRDQICSFLVFAQWQAKKSGFFVHFFHVFFQNTLENKKQKMHDKIKKIIFFCILPWNEEKNVVFFNIIFTLFFSVTNYCISGQKIFFFVSAKMLLLKS